MTDTKFHTHPNTTMGQEYGPSLLQTTPEWDRDQILYQALQREIEEAGCFRRAPWACGLKMAWVAAAYALGYVALLSDPDWMLRVGALLLVAFASVQAGFIAHDATDGAITKNRGLAFLFAQVYMTFASALSCAYFEFFHHTHHEHLNRGSANSDSASTSLNEYEGKFMRKLVSSNGVLFFIVMVCLRGLSFKLESFRFLLRNLKTTRWDQLFIVLHVGLWFALPLASLGVADTITNYALITLFAGPYVGSVLLLNHVGMSAVQSQSAIHPLQRITRTTRNLGTSWWSDFIFGGVNNHIEHHLFLDIPTVRLPNARRITRDFCQRHNLTYNETGYFRAIAEVTSYFRNLSPHHLASESLT